jgi:hypothetical protein
MMPLEKLAPKIVETAPAPRKVDAVVVTSAPLIYILVMYPVVFVTAM